MKKTNILASISAVIIIFSTFLTNNFDKEIQANISSPSPSSTIKIEDFTKALKAIRPIVPKKTQDKVIKYIQDSKSEELKKAFNLLIEKDLDTKLSNAKKTISGLTIDGDNSDWQSSGLIQTDEENDLLTIDTGEEINYPYPSKDIKSYAFIMDNNYIYTMIEPYEMPGDYDEYHFRTNIVNGDWKMIYGIAWAGWGNAIQEWDPVTGEWIRNIETQDTQFSKGENCFEAKIPIAEFKNNLPYSFLVEGVSWNESENFYDSAYQLFYEQSISEKYKKSALELLTKYATTTTLTADDPFPAVQAISDSYIYKRSDTSTRKLVIADGIEMIKKAKETKSYSFPNQKKLKDMPLEALLAWADRGLLQAGYKSVGFYPAKGAKLNKETYEFTVLQPEILDTCETLIEENDLLDSTSLKNTIYNLELWLNNKEEYRRTSASELKLLLDKDPTNEWVKKAYAANLEDEENGTMIIATVNGVDISKGRNFSASFQINYLKENDVYYGNCVDVTAVTLACDKALGIPAIHVGYGTTTQGDYEGIHTFPMYYSSKDDKWFPYQFGWNTVSLWAKPTSGKYNIFFSVDRPQSSSYFETYFKRTKTSDLWGNSRAYIKEISEKDWTKIDKEGYSMKDFKSIFFK